MGIQQTPTAADHIYESSLKVLHQFFQKMRQLFPKKKRIKTLPTNYQPVSPIVCKVLEKYLNV